MGNPIQNKLNLYLTTVIFSVLFALAGFSYNVWRMEISEHNNNMRTAGFEMLKELAELEQLVYIAHYDGDIKEGSPRKGWVTVGLIADLSMLTTQPVEQESLALKEVWSTEWSSMAENEDSAMAIVAAVDEVRAELKQLLNSLE